MLGESKDLLVGERGERSWKDAPRVAVDGNAGGGVHFGTVVMRVDVAKTGAIESSPAPIC